MSVSDPTQRLYCDPTDVVALTGCEPEKAATSVALASQAIEGYVTRPIPEPTPAAVETACISLASTVATASPGGAVVAEAIGGYSYRLASPTSAARALTITDDIADLLAPWRPRVYDISTAGSCGVVPIDAWQRNLEGLWCGVGGAPTVSTSVSLVPETVAVSGYAGDSLGFRIKVKDPTLVAGAVWSAQVRDTYDGPVLATFTITMEDGGATALLTLSPEDTAALGGGFSGVYDCQVELGADVRTLVRGGLSLTADVTRAVAP